jgi:hypothetical protein
MNFENITKNLHNGENMGSIQQKLYFGLHADVATWPTKPSSPADLSANGALTGDLVMENGKSLFELYLTDDTGEFTIEPVGEVDGKSFVMHLKFFHPTLQKKILGFMNAVKNENMVFVVPDSEGQKYLMGDAMRPAVFQGSPDGAGTGKETAARKGLSFEFTYKTPSVYVYEGSVPLTGSGSV